MTTRHTKALGFWIDAVLFAICAAVYQFMPSNPTWLSLLIKIVVYAGSVIGAAIVTPTLLTSSTTTDSDSSSDS